MNPLLLNYMRSLSAEIREALWGLRYEYAAGLLVEFRMLYRSRHKPLKWIYRRPLVARGN